MTIPLAFLNMAETLSAGLKSHPDILIDTLEFRNIDEISALSPISVVIFSVQSWAADHI